MKRGAPNNAFAIPVITSTTGIEDSIEPPVATSEHYYAIVYMMGDRMKLDEIPIYRA